MENGILINKGGTLRFNTYYNALSIKKWKKYTDVKSIALRFTYSGYVKFCLYGISLYQDKVRRTELFDAYYTAKEQTEQYVEIPFDYRGDILYFTLEGLDDSSFFYGGEYVTQNTDTNNVHIALNICTFKRERFIQRTVASLQRDILDNPQSPLHGNLDVYIVDNGQSLAQDAFTHENIHLFPNKNCGGAGGFARGMLEIMKARDKITHMIIMDDDIILDPNVLERTFALLAHMKKQYSGHFIGGAMFDISAPAIQRRSFSYRNGSLHATVPKGNLNMANEHNIVFNEVEDLAQYNGWWYCCVPMESVTTQNLPLPVFIHCDDVEYGIRSKKKVISMNGIAIWHQELSNRYVSVQSAYYDIRNSLYLYMAHFDGIRAEQVAEYVVRQMRKAILTYRYKDVRLCARAVTDALAGVDFLKETDAVQLHQDLVKEGYKEKSIDELSVPLNYKNYLSNFDYKEGRKKKWVRKLTQNGLRLKANRSIVVPMGKPIEGCFYRAGSALYYNEEKQTGFFVRRDLKESKACEKVCAEVKKQILAHYPEAKKSFKAHMNEVTNADFWQRYLGL